MIKHRLRGKSYIRADRKGCRRDVRTDEVGDVGAPSTTLGDQRQATSQGYNRSEGPDRPVDAAGRAVYRGAGR
jgi:hypothetical protein